MATMPEVPSPEDPRPVKTESRPIAFVAVLGGGVCLFAVVVGLVLLGLDHENEVTDTGLASIGATLAGGFAGWFARGAAQRERE
jgi:F0F1-type ATP synthase membrane subunit c/vacuolar-type H+-ATPase subunit K